MARVLLCKRWQTAVLRRASLLSQTFERSPTRPADEHSTRILVRKHGAFRRASVALAALLLWGAPVFPAFSWSPGTAAASDTGRFVVDTANRRDVMSFYHAVYGASEGFEARAGWSGNVAALAPGTTSLELKKDVLRRVNFYRALAGLQADLALNPEKSVKAQEAALLTARNRALSHYPGANFRNGPA
jgi:hypothetical protein